MSLTPEDRRRIYEEEKVRLEAQQQLQSEAKAKVEAQQKNVTYGCLGCLGVFIVIAIVAALSSQSPPPASVTSPATTPDTSTPATQNNLLPYSEAAKYFKGDLTAMCGKDVQEGHVICAQLRQAIICPKADTWAAVKGAIQTAGGKNISILDQVALGSLAEQEGCYMVDTGTIVLLTIPIIDPNFSLPYAEGADLVKILAGPHAGQIGYTPVNAFGEPYQP